MPGRADTSTGDAFVNDIDPEVAVISSRWRCDHKNPKLVTIKQLVENQALVYVTGDGQDPELGAGVAFRRGDPNADGMRNITDAVFILSFLFRGGAEPPCRKSADTDDNGAVELSDGVFLLNFLFRRGPRPAAPFAACATDDTADALTCETYRPCR